MRKTTKLRIANFELRIRRQSAVRNPQFAIRNLLVPARFFLIRNPQSAIRNLLGCAFLLALGAPTAGAAKFPMPEDAKVVQAPYQVTIGSQPIEVQGVRTTKSPEEARAFYEKALKKQGWELKPHPWAGQFERMEQKVEKDYPGYKEDPAYESPYVQSGIANIQALKDHLGQSLYAAQDDRQVMISFTPQDRGTLVSINAWNFSSSQGFFGDKPLEIGSASPDALGGPPVGQGQGGEPLGGFCCSGESVPEPMRKLPGVVPRYSSGRMVATGKAPSSQPNQFIANEMYFTGDSADEVAAFYRQHMAYSGWAPWEMVAPSLGNRKGMGSLQEAVGEMESLAFRNEKALCVVVIAERGALGFPDLPEALRAQGSQTASGPEQGGFLSNERTVIMVQYIEGLQLQIPSPFDPNAILRSSKNRKRGR